MENLRDKMIEDNLMLVHKVIRSKFKYNYNDYDDLYSEGVIGLINAVDSFDVSKGNKFSTYAFWCIYYNIINYLERVKNKYNVLSLDVEYEFFDKISFISMIEDESVDIEGDIIKLEEYKIIDKLLERVKLSDRDRFIVLLHYGFYNGRVYSRHELAKLFNMTHQNVSLIIKNFLSKIERLVLIEYGRDSLNNKDKFKLYTRKVNKK